MIKYLGRDSSRIHQILPGSDTASNAQCRSLSKQTLAVTFQQCDKMEGCFSLIN